MAVNMEEYIFICNECKGIILDVVLYIREEQNICTWMQIQSTFCFDNKNAFIQVNKEIICKKNYVKPKK